jgi:hypothetical protein
MSKRFWLAAVAMLGVLFLVPSTNSRAADEKITRDQEEAMKSDEDVCNISMAYELAAIGRKQKAPEMLVCAAKLLKGTNFSTRPGKEEATLVGSKDKILAGPQLDLSAQATELLDEAQKIAENTKNQPVLELIKKARTEEGRGAVGGPKTYFHQPGAGATITLDVPFVGNAPGRVWVQGNGANRLTLKVTGPKGWTGTMTGLNPSVAWSGHPAGTYTISITNDGRTACAYRLFTN